MEGRQQAEPGRLHYAFPVIGLVACSLLVYEILLIRVCALRLLFHFGFLVVSNSMLAFGASGTVLTLKQDVWMQKPRRSMARIAGGYVLALLITYALLLGFPLDGLSDLSKPLDLLVFALFNLVAAVPFFFGGLVVAMVLSFNADRVNALYFTDLVGAGIGCLLAPALLPLVGAGGAFITLTVLAVIAATVAVPEDTRRRALPAAGALVAVLLILLPWFDALAPVKGRGLLRLTREVSVATTEADEFSAWTGTSRIDLISSSQLKPKGGFVYNRGSRLDGLPPVPEQKIILQDASAGTTIVNFTEQPEALEILRRSTYSAALRLKDAPEVLIIGAGGGNDLWSARAAGASRIRAIELNGAILHIYREVLPHFVRALVDDPALELVNDEGRSALMRDSGRYDVVQLTGVDTWTGLKSGGYVLAENYLYTREAIGSMLEHLKPGGTLQIIRFAAEMEILRLLSNVWSALAQPPVERFARQVMVLATPDQMATVLVSPDGFDPGEVTSTRSFAFENGVSIAYLPDNLDRNRVAAFVLDPEKDAFIDSYPRDISATTDDRPYFFSFWRWRDLWASSDGLAEPPSVSQGNPFLLFIQLAFSAALSVLLIVLPLTRLGDVRSAGAGRFLPYFAGVGLGFIIVEIGLIQKLTLFLGHPIYSITVTLATVLVFAGLGSLLSARWFDAAPARAWGVPLGLIALVMALLIASPLYDRVLITLPLAGRIAVAVLSLAPISLLMGVPFAYGLRLLNAENPSLIPWAWAVNGCFSVIGSILTVVLSMNLGFAVALGIGLAAYVLAFAAISGRRVTSSG